MKFYTLYLDLGGIKLGTVVAGDELQTFAKTVTGALNTADSDKEQLDAFVKRVINFAQPSMISQDDPDYARMMQDQDQPNTADSQPNTADSQPNTADIPPGNKPNTADLPGPAEDDGDLTVYPPATEAFVKDVLKGHPIKFDN